MTKDLLLSARNPIAAVAVWRLAGEPFANFDRTPTPRPCRRKPQPRVGAQDELSGPIGTCTTPSIGTDPPAPERSQRLARRPSSDSDTMCTMKVRPLDDHDRSWLVETVTLAWGLPVVSISGIHDPRALPGFVAEEGDQRVGVVTYRTTPRECEVVTLNSMRTNL